MKVVVAFIDREEKLPVEVEAEDTVKSLKKKVHDGDSDRVLLIYRGQILQDEMVVMDSLHTTSTDTVTIQAVLRKQKGMAASVPPTPVHNASYTSLLEDATPLTTTAAATAASVEPSPSPSPSPSSHAAPVAMTTASQPLHMIRLSVPCPNGPKRILVPCYEYVMSRDTSNNLVFSISPKILKTLCETGATVDIPQSYNAPAGETAQAPPAPPMTQQEQINLIIEQGLGYWRRFQDVFYLLFKLVILFKLVSVITSTQTQFWVFLVIFATVLVAQTAIVAQFLRPRMVNLAQQQLPNRLHLPRRQQGGVINSVIMFVSSMVPAIHANWAANLDAPAQQNQNF